jgi:hypothetical protein
MISTRQRRAFRHSGCTYGTDRRRNSRRFVTAGSGAHFQDNRRYAHRPDLSAAEAPATVVPSLPNAAFASSNSSCAISRISGSSSIISAVAISSWTCRQSGKAAADIGQLRVFTRERAKTFLLSNGRQHRRAAPVLLHGARADASSLATIEGFIAWY